MNLLTRTIHNAPWNERAVRGMDDVSICIRNVTEAPRIKKNKKVISKYGDR